SAVAVEARFVHRAAQALARPLARHLDEAELADAVDRRLGLVLGEALLEGAPDALAVLRLFHVDQVEDDQTADVAEAQLVGNLLDGLQIGLQRSLFEILAPLADETSGVHV